MLLLLFMHKIANALVGALLWLSTASALDQPSDTERHDLASSMDFCFDMAKFSAALPAAICAQYLNGKLLHVPIDHAHPKDKRQSLFYFRMNAFDPAKPNLIVHGGGPGVVTLADGSNWSSVRNSFNVIAFHSRGSGCSAEPMDAEASLAISVESELADIEAIRKDLGLERWDAAYGVSAGTTIMRTYAAKYPTRVKALILEGVADDSRDDLGIPPETLLAMWKKFVEENKATLMDRFSSKQIQDLGEKFQQLMQRRTVSFKRLLVQAAGKPDYAATLLASWGTTPSVDPVLDSIPVMLSYDATPELINSALTYFVRASEGPHLDQAGDYPTTETYAAIVRDNFFPDLTTFNPSRVNWLLSWRNMFFETVHAPAEKTCHSVPQLILQGGKDLATVATGARALFAMTNCYPAHSVYVENPETGHFGTFSDACEGDMIRAFTKNPRGAFALPESCKLTHLVLEERAGQTAMAAGPSAGH